MLKACSRGMRVATPSYKESHESLCHHLFCRKKADMARNERKTFPSAEVSLPGKHLPEELVCDTSQINYEFHGQGL